MLEMERIKMQWKKSMDTTGKGPLQMQCKLFKNKMVANVTRKANYQCHREAQVWKFQKTVDLSGLI